MLFFYLDFLLSLRGRERDLGVGLCCRRRRLDFNFWVSRGWFRIFTFVSRGWIRFLTFRCPEVGLEFVLLGVQRWDSNLHF